MLPRTILRTQGASAAPEEFLKRGNSSQLRSADPKRNRQCHGGNERAVGSREFFPIFTSQNITLAWEPYLL